MTLDYIRTVALAAAIVAGASSLGFAQTTTDPVAPATTTVTTDADDDGGFDMGWIGLLGLLGLAGLTKSRRDTTVRTTTTAPRV